LRAQRLVRYGAIENAPLLEEDLPIPEPGEGEVLLHVGACGVCHTDLHLVEGELPARAMPVTPGHQVVGVVTGVGPGVQGIREGDRVGVAWLASACGECVFCRSGQENLCRSARFTGYDRDGGFAEYATADAGFVLPLPGGFSDTEAAPLLCAGIIGYRSLHRAELKPGEVLGLVGFGASAHLALPVALSWGCRVFVFTRSEHHRRLALQLGAAWAGGIDDPPPSDVDRAILFAPVGALVPATLGLIRPGGTLAINAIHMSPIPEMPYERLYDERSVRTVANATRQDGREFLETAAAIGLTVTVETFPLHEANKALDDVKHSRVPAAAVLIP
jgi:propanol-preferring alcohol dehydrogenase